MIRRMENLKIRTKVILIAAILLLVNVMMTGISIRNQVIDNQQNLKMVENDIRTSYDNNLKNQVQQVITLLTKIEAKRAEGEYTLEEAKKLAADLVRELRYGNDDNYFWIDTYEGVNVVLLGGDKEGTNRYDMQDVNKLFVVQELIKAGQQEGGGFVDYWFPKPDEKEASPKRGYTLAFEPYQWVIGTGNYTDYIDKEVDALSKQANEELRTSIIEFSIIFAAVFCFAVLIAFFMARMLNRDFAQLRKYFNTLATGDFTVKLPDSYTRRKDDFGVLAVDIEKMKGSVSQLIGSAKSEADKINDVAVNINSNIKELNCNIEDVAATTQELAASMEETAASAQEMSATSEEIETASRTIAQKSQEAALQVLEISKRAKDTKENVRLSQDKADAIGKEIEGKLQKALEQVQVVSQINELAESIMSITDQTNLLALNASIEAARAGEHGKGFAVVASEIRRLADQSKVEVENIQGIIGEVTEAVSNLSDNAGELLHYVGTDVSANFRSFSEVVDAYQNDAIYVDGLITDFSATSEELSASIENIMTAVNEVAKAATEGASGTGDIAQKIANITDKSFEVMKQGEVNKQSSEKLTEEISHFSVN